LEPAAACLDGCKKTGYVSKEGQRMANKNLGNARKTKNDEFYTQLPDIDRELMHYKHYFRGKTILCNCDDPRVSKFFYFFYARFHTLGLKRLIATCYKNLNPDLFSQNLDEKAVYCIYDGTDRTDDKYTDYETFIKQNEWGVLKEDGDFRSAECIELLKQADIVVTNPPFSLFREYVAQLIEYNKKFIIIGNVNTITYKEIFSLFRENKIWVGYSPRSIDFLTSDGSIENINACWFTNLDTTKRHENLILFKNYNSKEYQKYDNYDAIEVSKVVEIPQDYDGVMGVPITFLDKYNPEQFEIIGLIAGNIKGMAGITSKIGKDGPYINGKLKYGRILIRRR
jgi:hypothetical protein